MLKQTSRTCVPQWLVDMICHSCDRGYNVFGIYFGGARCLFDILTRSMDTSLIRPRVYAALKFNNDSKSIRQILAL